MTNTEETLTQALITLSEATRLLLLDRGYEKTARKVRRTLAELDVLWNGRDSYAERAGDLERDA